MLGALGIEDIPPADVKNAGLILVAFVFPLQLIATIMAFLARDTIGATALGLFTTSWLTIGTLLIRSEPGATSRSLAYYLVYFSALIALLGVVAIPAKPLIAMILAVSTARGVLGAIYEFGGNTTYEHVGGVIAFVLSGLALYSGLAFLLEDSRQREVLPLFRRGDARDAIEGNLADQLRGLDTEAGVRTQL
jgi:succinate-acetate transporter protein